MTTALAEHRILEIAAGSIEVAGGRVDEANGVIKRVKVLGLHSRNVGRTIGLTFDEFGEAVNKPYSYTAEALRQAAPLYEGASVFNNHTEFGYDEQTGRRVIKGTERDNDDLLGWLQNVTVESDGLYADLHYIKNHPMAARLVEIANRRPDKLSLSHEALIDQPVLKDGQILLTRIVKVDSVALVSEKPGTTKGLFESAAKHSGTNSMTTAAKPKTNTTIKKLLETVAPATKGHRRLLEMIGDEAYGAEMAEAPVEVAAEASPEDQIKAGILAAIIAKLEKAKPEEIEAVLTALGMGDSLSAAAAGKAGKPDESGSTPKEETTVESTAKADRGNLILECVGILRECGINEYHETVLEAMANLPSKEKRLAFARSQKPAGADPTPRSQSPTKVAETQAKADGIDYSKTAGLGARALRGA